MRQGEVEAAQGRDVLPSLGAAASAPGCVITETQLLSTQRGHPSARGPAEASPPRLWAVSSPDSALHRETGTSPREPVRPFGEGAEGRPAG